MGRWSRLLATPFIEFAEIREGDHVLDVGSGTGVLSLAIASQRKGTRIHGIDPTGDFVRAAAAAAASSGSSKDATTLEFEVGDAQALPFSGGTFDRVVSTLVLNFIPNPGRALDEMIRVAKPEGGIVSAAVWDYRGEMEMLRVFWDEAKAKAPSSDEGNMPLCKKGELATLWREKGLENVEETSLSIDLAFASFDDFWSPFLLGQGPAGALVASLSTEERNDLEARLRARIGDKLTMRAAAWAAKGKRSTTRRA